MAIRPIEHWSITNTGEVSKPISTTGINGLTRYFEAHPNPWGLRVILLRIIARVSGSRGGCSFVRGHRSVVHSNNFFLTLFQAVPPRERCPRDRVPVFTLSSWKWTPGVSRENVRPLTSSPVRSGARGEEYSSLNSRSSDTE